MAVIGHLGWQRWVLITALMVSGARPVASAVTMRPDARSPLATDGVNMYAVAEDHQTLISSRPDREDWSPLATIPRADVRGLTWVRDRLVLLERRRRFCSVGLDHGSR